MLKSISRIIAVLLIPCVLMDQSLAFSQQRLISPNSIAALRPTQLIQFQEEALEPIGLWMHRAIETVKAAPYVRVLATVSTIGIAAAVIAARPHVSPTFVHQSLWVIATAAIAWVGKKFGFVPGGLMVTIPEGNAGQKVFDSNDEMYQTLSHFKASLLFLGHGSKSQFQDTPATLKEVDALVEKFNSEYGRGQWMAVFGGDGFNEAKPDVAHILKHLHDDHHVPILAIQSDIVQKQWGGVDKYIDYVRYVPTHMEPDGKTVVWGGFREGKPVGPTSLYLGDRFASGENGVLKGVVSLGGGPIALAETQYAYEKGIPITYVRAKTKYPEVNGEFGSLDAWVREKVGTSIESGQVMFSRQGSNASGDIEGEKILEFYRYQFSVELAPDRKGGYLLIDGARRYYRSLDNELYDVHPERQGPDALTPIIDENLDNFLMGISQITKWFMQLHPPREVREIRPGQALLLNPRLDVEISYTEKYVYVDINGAGLYRIDRKNAAIVERMSDHQFPGPGIAGGVIALGMAHLYFDETLRRLTTHTDRSTLFASLPSELRRPGFATKDGNNWWHRWLSKPLVGWFIRRLWVPIYEQYSRYKDLESPQDFARAHSTVFDPSIQGRRQANRWDRNRIQKMASLSDQAFNSIYVKAVDNFSFLGSYAHVLGYYAGLVAAAWVHSRFEAKQNRRGQQIRNGHSTFLNLLPSFAAKLPAESEKPSSQILREAGFDEIAPGYFLLSDGYLVHLETNGSKETIKEIFTPIERMRSQDAKVVSVEVQFNRDFLQQRMVKITYSNGSHSWLSPGVSSSGGREDGSIFTAAELRSQTPKKDRLIRSGLVEIVPGSGIFEGIVEKDERVVVVCRNEQILLTGVPSRYMRYRDDVHIVEGEGGGIEFQQGPLRFALGNYGLDFRGLDTSVEVNIPLSERQRYTQPPNAAGFVIGGVNSNETIDTLTELTGKSIAQIEQDGRPRHASGAGFLRQDESLKDVLKEDNSFVLARGLTHQQLAEPLFYVMNILRYAGMPIAASGELKAKGFEYRYKGKLYRAHFVGWRGTQHSIFNDDASASIDFTVTSVETGASVHFSAMVPDYIWRYGFYEGHTGYRVEPADIVATFFADESDPISQARAGQQVTLGTADDISRLLRIDTDDLLRIFPRLHFRITNLESVATLRSVAERHLMIEGQLAGGDQMTWALDPFTIEFGNSMLGSDESRLLQSLWPNLSPNEQDRVVAALQSINLMGKDLWSMKYFFDHIKYDPKLVQKIIMSSNEAALGLILELAYGGEYRFDPTGVKTQDNPLVPLLRSAVNQLTGNAPVPQINLRSVQSRADLDQALVILRGMDRHNSPFRIGWGSGGDSTHYSLGKLYLVNYDPTTGEIKEINIGLSDDGRLLIGIVDNFYFAVDDRGHHQIVQVTDTPQSPIKPREPQIEPHNPTSGPGMRGMSPFFPSGDPADRSAINRMIQDLLRGKKFIIVFALSVMGWNNSSAWSSILPAPILSPTVVEALIGNHRKSATSRSRFTYLVSLAA